MLCPKCKATNIDGSTRCASCGADMAAVSGVAAMLAEHPVLSALGLIGCGMILAYALPNAPAPPPPPTPAMNTMVTPGTASPGDMEDMEDMEHQSPPSDAVEIRDEGYGRPVLSPEARFWADDPAMYAAAHRINQEEISSDNVKNFIGSFGFFLILGVVIVIIRRKLNS